MKNKYVQYVLILITGIAIGAIFYPSKTITRETTHNLEEKIKSLETEKKNITSFFERQLDMEKRQSKKYHKQVTKNTESLKEENFKLKQKITEKRFKIVRPDGTIEEKWFKESETDVISSTVTKIKSEFTSKVKSIENKWKRIHEKRIAQIKKAYEKKSTTDSEKQERTITKEKIEINKRSFGISLGITNNKEYFSTISYDIFGPFFISGLFKTDESLKNKDIGLGIGIRW